MCLATVATTRKASPARSRRLLPLLLLVLACASPARAQIVVETSADERNTNGDCSLREAIINANNDDQSGSTDCATGLGNTQITFDSSTDGAAIQLTRTGVNENSANTGDLDVTGDLTITGNGAATTIIDGNATDRVFQIVSGTVTLEDVTIRNGSLLGAGGGIHNAGTLTIRQSTVSGNQVSGDTFLEGGGIYNAGTMTIEQSEISGNTIPDFGGLGGGIYHDSGTLTLRNTTISGNTVGSGRYGGGVYADMSVVSSSVIMNNCTVTLNQSPTDAGGIYLFDSVGAFTVSNSIVAENISGGNNPDAQGQFTSGGYNVLGVDGPDMDGWNGTGDQTGTAGSPLDPVLGALGGTAPRYHELQFGSPAYNRGDPGSGCEAVDQPGVARPEHGRCDVGAVESVAVLPVELVAFAAIHAGDAVLLTWATASETNNAGFEVEHLAGDDAEWSRLGFVAGAGTTAEAQPYAYRAAGLAAGTHRFRLRQVDYDGAFEYSPEVEVEVVVPGAFHLSPAYPNPFNPQTAFTLAVEVPQHVRLVVYDVLGRQVAVLHDGRLDAGEAQRFTFGGTGLPSGTYLLRAEGETFRASRRLVLTK